MTENNDKLVNVMKVVHTVSERGPARFDEWHRNTCMSLSMFCSRIFNTKPYQAEYLRRKQPNQRRRQGSRHNARQDMTDLAKTVSLLYSSQRSTSWFSRMRTLRFPRNIYTTYQELVAAYKIASDDNRVHLPHDLTIYFQDVGFLRDELECIGKTVRISIDIPVQWTPEDCQDVRFTTYRDATSRLARIKKKKHKPYLDNMLRGKEIRSWIAGRVATMVAQLAPEHSDTIYDCKG